MSELQHWPEPSGDPDLPSTDSYGAMQRVLSVHACSIPASRMYYQTSGCKRDDAEVCATGRSRGGGAGLGVAGARTCCPSRRQNLNVQSLKCADVVSEWSLVVLCEAVTCGLAALSAC